MNRHAVANTALARFILLPANVRSEFRRWQLPVMLAPHVLFAGAVIGTLAGAIAIGVDGTLRSSRTLLAVAGVLAALGLADYCLSLVLVILAARKARRRQQESAG